MSVFRSRAAPIALGALLIACSRHPTPEAGPPMIVDVGVPSLTKVAQVASAVGDIQPGASPVVIAPADGRVTTVAAMSGSAIAAGQILARLRPAGPSATPRRSLAIRAAAPATVTRVFIHNGQRVRRGQRLFGLAGPQIRQARIPFPAALRPALRIGKPVVLHSPLAPRSPLPGTIARLTSPKMPDAVYAWITLPPRRGFTVGSPLRADVATGTRTGLVIPRSAAPLRRIGTVVFVVHGDRVHERRIQVAQVLPEGVVVRSGLRPGTRIVIRPPARLANGMRVRITARGAG